MTRDEFAIKLGKNYGVEVDPANLTGEEYTTFEFVKANFPPHKVIEWLENENKNIKGLRVRFGLKPYDKFDAETKKIITELKSQL